MCTVTVIRVDDALRVACNRDERRSRPSAHPPFITRDGNVQVLAPLDPLGQGTWIAANSFGLVFALLNMNGGGSGPARSRGAIILALAASTTIDEAVAGCADLALDEFPPFRLLVIAAASVAELTSTAAGCAVRMHAAARPLLFASSSLGDVLVDGPRRQLFEQMMAQGETAARQDAFHAHRWRDRPDISVHMSRADACTVSTTVVEVTAREVRMTYRPAHGAAGPHVGLAIVRQDVPHAAAHRPGREHAAV
jgi:hypothetical protein